MSDLFWLTQKQMAARVILPQKLRLDDRWVLSSIALVNRDGLRWCNAPWDMVHTRRSTSVGTKGVSFAT